MNKSVKHYCKYFGIISLVLNARFVIYYVSDNELPMCFFIDSVSYVTILFDCYYLRKLSIAQHKAQFEPLTLCLVNFWLLCIRIQMFTYNKLQFLSSTWSICFAVDSNRREFILPDTWLTRIKSLNFALCARNHYVHNLRTEQTPHRGFNNYWD